MTTYIKVKWQFEGFHTYINAPEEVSFLKYKHRHLFKCSAQIQVFHDERELEFIIVQRKLKSVFNDGNMSNKSCETIAKEIIKYLIDQYGDNRKVVVEVSEDGENSSIVDNL